MIILAIVGNAGVGKDTLAAYFGVMAGWNIIRSYTTRPIREGETNGVEHWFVKFMSEADRANVFAYTRYGGYDYWTTFNQFLKSVPNVYVVDEKGLADIINAKQHTEISLTTVYVTADKEVRKRRGISENRMERDATRINTNQFKYDYVIVNNGEREDMFEQADYIITQI